MYCTVPVASLPAVGAPDCINKLYTVQVQTPCCVLYGLHGSILGLQAPIRVSLLLRNSVTCALVYYQPGVFLVHLSGLR